MGSTWGAEYTSSGEAPGRSERSGSPGVPVCQDCGAPAEVLGDLAGWCADCLNDELAADALEYEYDPGCPTCGGAIAQPPHRSGELACPTCGAA